MLGQIPPDDVGIRVVRRHFDAGRVRDQRSVGPRPDLALVGRHEIEHRKEGLALGAIPPVGRGARFVPDRPRLSELVIRLGVVGAIVAGGAQILGESLDLRRRNREIGRGHVPLRFRGGAHVMGSDRALIHPGDDGGPTRRADARRGKGTCEPAAVRCQTVQGRRAGQGVGVTSQPRAEVLGRDPQDVRSQGLARRRGCRGRRTAREKKAGTRQKWKEMAHWFNPFQSAAARPTRLRF